MSEMLLREALANVTSGGWTDDERIEKVVGYQQTNMTASAFFSERVLVGGPRRFSRVAGIIPIPDSPKYWMTGPTRRRLRCLVRPDGTGDSGACMANDTSCVHIAT